jgi:hypothetical protein
MVITAFYWHDLQLRKAEAFGSSAFSSFASALGLLVELFRKRNWPVAFFFWVFFMA